MFKAVIFDFDGVITDSEVLHYRAFNEVLTPFGIEISLREYYKDYLGLGDYDLFKLFCEKGILTLTEDGIQELITKKHAYFDKLARTEGKIIEGVRPFLEMLSTNKVPMAICSGALLPEIELILEQSNLRHHFIAVVSREQIRNGKPHPEGFHVALQRLNKHLGTTIQPGHCIVIEDASWGINAALAAGMHPVAVTNSYEANQLQGAEKITDRLDKLTLDELSKLCA